VEVGDQILFLQKTPSAWRGFSFLFFVRKKFIYVEGLSISFSQEQCFPRVGCGQVTHGASVFNTMWSGLIPGYGGRFWT
jgi:hypothetical protein